MNAIITDADILKSLSPIDLSAYLRNRQWRREGETPNELAQYWSHTLESGDSVDVLIPTDRTVRDFSRRMMETLQTLQQIEGRSQLAILTDIQQISSDVIRWRWIQDNAQDGTIPLEQGEQFIAQVRIQLLAAACSTARPKQYFGAQKPAVAQEYMKAARLGQSERGSYVVTVQSPVPPQLSSPAMPDVDEIEPFERRVTLTLGKALSELRHLASNALTTGLPDLESLATKGVSANLCDSVAVMLGADQVRRDIEVTVSMAGSRPSQIASPTRLRLSSDLGPVIAQVGQRLRETATQDDYELTGFVTDLRRGPQDPLGVATVKGQIDGAFRRVEIAVAADTYNSVLVPAHTNRLMIRCEGELQKVHGRSYQLKNARGFEILATE